MKRIFVTVGTTPFPRLINAASVLQGRYECYYQTGDVELPPQYFKFLVNIESHVKAADLVICHCGAGTVYALLEQRKRILVVPNLDRSDKHQLELAEYVDRENLGQVCNDLDALENAVDIALKREFRVYKKHSFFKYGEIQEFIDGLRQK